MRRAVARLLDEDLDDAWDRAFGSWSDLEVDSVEYVRRLQTRRAFMRRFRVIDVDRRKVAERVVEVRRNRRFRLPDAIIWATALSEGCLLVTRNTDAFPATDPGIRVPYSV